MTDFSFADKCRLLFAFACACALPGANGVAAAPLQTVTGHVPEAVARLRPAGHLPATNILQLAVSLPLRHREDLTNLLQRLYDPGSPDYHQYLTPEQFTQRFGPDAGDYEALADFFRTNGCVVTATHPNRAVLDVRGAVGDIEKLLHTSLRYYPHPSEDRNFFAPDVEPSLDVSIPLLHISGLDNLLQPRPMSLKSAALDTPAAGSAPGGDYMGNDFRAAYVPGTTLTGAGQIVGLLEFDGYFPGDVTAYRSLASVPNVPLKTVLLDGFNGAPGQNNAEVSLDIDMATCMAPGLSAIIVYEGELTDDILNRMATDNLAKQLSASWLYPIDSGSEQIFLQFAAQGQSFFNAAGDDDAYVGAVDTPADDPNITIVGGTDLSTSGPGGSWVSETVWNLGGGIGTGGGISTTYPIPTWQQGISMTANNGSTAMRNLPDVALTAQNIWVVYDNGAAGGFDGTSCATPLWAAFTALVNQQALANGKSTQGFINPAIYALGKGTNYASAFHDIVSGNNTSPQSPADFPAVTGYDLCTGWGTPAGTSLINLLAPPDTLRITPAAGFIANGGSGGPFTTNSQTFLLTNAGVAAVNWSLGTAAAWLTAFPVNGTLSPGGAAISVTVRLNAAASNQVPGVYTASVWFTNLADGFAQSRAFTLNVITAPSFTTSPTNQSVLGGASAFFSAQAIGGAPLTWQWRQNNANLSDGTNISGSATSALAIAQVVSSNVGSYSIVVSNAAGAVTSSPPALLSIVSSGPVFTLQPAGQFALVGNTVNFTAAALGNAPLSWQWRCNGSNISGSTTANLTLSAVSATNTGTYTIVVSNSINAVTSAPAVLNVYALADMQLLQNGGFETGDFSFWNLSGNSSFDTVSDSTLDAHSGVYGAEMGPIGQLGYISQTVPTVPGEVYLLSLWLDSPDGATPNEFQVAWNGYTLFDQTNLTAFGWSNYQFAVTATATSTTVQLGFRDDNSFLGLDDISLKPLLNPAGAPVITAQPPSQTYAPVGATNTISITATGRTPLFYQWLSNNILLNNATDSALTWPNIATNDAATYSVIVSNSLGQGVSSNAILSVLVGNLSVVTFDDLGVTNLPVPNGYASLTWSNFYHMDPAVSAPNPSGYVAGVVSHPNVAFNAFGSPAFLSNSTPFDFLSAWLTAAWNDNLRLEVKGYTNSTLVYDNAYSLSATTPALINFNCVGVTRMEFVSSGGVPDPLYGDSGTEFVMDNASIIINGEPPPPNDQCAGAVVITGDPYTNVQSTLGATSTGDPVPACMTNFANGVWYEYTPAVTGLLEADATGSSFNAGVAVYSGACGSLTSVSCGGGMTPVTGGVTYYILAGAVENLTGTLVFHLSFTSTTTGPPVVLSAPTNATVPAGAAAAFAVAGEGAQPLHYQWQRNGSNIAGATASAYTAANVQSSDSGALYSCQIHNTLGVTNSAAASLTVTPPGQLVQNGGFETGDFSHWTLSGNTLDTYVNSLDVHSGQYGAQLGPYGSLGYISQSLSTSPGQVYQISLWLFNPPDQVPNEFSIAWNGAIVFDQTNLPGLDWTNILIDVPAAITNSVLKIGFRDDPSYLGLDDITVLPLRPLLQKITRSGKLLSFNWSALPGEQYQIQSITNLALTNWISLGSVTATNYTMTTSENIVSNVTPQFYRIVLIP